VTGQTDFESAPPYGTSGVGGGRATSAGFAGSTPGVADTANAPSLAPAAPGNAQASLPRSVQETDLYRLDGNRLYYLNSYRGLMVFDVTTSISPSFWGARPFLAPRSDVRQQRHRGHCRGRTGMGRSTRASRSTVRSLRGLDATDPSNIQVLGAEPTIGGCPDQPRQVAREDLDVAGIGRIEATHDRTVNGSPVSSVPYQSATTMTAMPLLTNI